MGLSRAWSRGFTLIELLVVIGVIAVLVGILFPIINHAYKSSQVTAMKFNFHAIADALEAYKQDFNDYPKNPLALTDPPPPAIYTYSNSTDEYRPATPRTDGTLAMALLGPGPYAAINANGLSTNYPNGDVDGGDGSGFRTQMSIVATVTLSGPVASGATLVGVMGGAPSSNVNNPQLPPFTVISLGGPGSPDAHLVVTRSAANLLALATPVQDAYAAGTAASLLAPTGKTWGPYLPVDKFKVSYIEIPQTGQTYESKFLPVLLDNWGNPIIYMPAYNSYTNHSSAGVTSQALGLNPGRFPLVGQTVPVSISVGPLLGWPSLTYAKYNTPMKTKTQVANLTGPSVFWSGPLNSWTSNPSIPSDTITFTTGQIAAILYKLGDRDGNNMINDGETLSVQQPYFLISAGPDGVFTGLYQGSTAGTSRYWQTIMNKSTNVYSFDP